MNTLEKDLNYRVHVRVLNAKSWVPQHRERIFLAGFLDDTGFCFDSMSLPDPSNGPRLQSILHPEDGSETAELGYTEGPRAKVHSRYTLSQHLWTILSRMPDPNVGGEMVSAMDYLVRMTLLVRYRLDTSKTGQRFSFSNQIKSVHDV